MEAGGERNFVVSGGSSVFVDIVFCICRRCILYLWTLYFVFIMKMSKILEQGKGVRGALLSQGAARRPDGALGQVPVIIVPLQCIVL